MMIILFSVSTMLCGRLQVILSKIKLSLNADDNHPYFVAVYFFFLYVALFCFLISLAFLKLCS